jgi:hypothetical protein
MKGEGPWRAKLASLDNDPLFHTAYSRYHMSYIIHMQYEAGSGKMRSEMEESGVRESHESG